MKAKMMAVLERVPIDSRRVVGFLLIVCSLLAASTPILAEEKQTRGPGQYLFWAGNDVSKCNSFARVANRLPGQDVPAASERGEGGFLQWDRVPRIQRVPMIGSTPEYYALSSLHLGLAVGQPPVYVMRWAASLSNMFTHSLYVLESLPKSDSDFRGIVARPPAFGGAASARIEELKRKHGANWEDWYIGDHVLVSVYGSTPPTFFATETFHDKSNPSRAIVFVLDSSGMSLELCALRRVCGCDTVCYQALNTDREKRSLRPSRKYCDRIKD